VFVGAHKVVWVQRTRVVQFKSVEDLFAAKARFLLVEGQVNIRLRGDRVDQSSVDFIVCAYGLEDGDLDDFGYVVADFWCGFCFFLFVSRSAVPDAGFDCRVGWIGRLPPFVELLLSDSCGGGIGREL
jgi:hypothetical protein